MINRWLVTLCIFATFTLVMCSAIASPLHEFRWQQRILLINQADKTQLTEIWQFYKRHTQEFRDRRILLISVEGENIRCVPRDCPSLNIRHLDLSDIPHHTMLLFGLDGGRKAAYSSEYLSFEEVFKDIDGMPMRKAELY